MNKLRNKVVQRLEVWKSSLMINYKRFLAF